jgi:hypothetical protein
MDISLFGIGQFGKSSNVTSQERLNCYLEVQPGDDRSKVAFYGTPGLILYKSFGETPIRGEYDKGDFVYVVHRGTFYEVNNAGVATARGTIGTTSGRVYMADNGVQLMLIDGTLGYIYNFGTLAFTQITDVDFMGAASVTWMDGYFIVGVPNTQKFQISALYDGLTWDALDFSSAEANPDNIVRVFADNSNLYLFGSISTEFWSNTGATDFPYARISGGATEWGCGAINSITKYDNSVAFLAKNRMGEVMVARMNGYQPQKISTPELDHIINSYASVSDATTFAYLLGGHPMLQLNFPAAGESWLYDGLSQAWSKLKSYNVTRHRAEMGVSFLSKILVTDYANGNLYRLDANTYTDNGDPIEFELISRHVCNDDHRLIVSKLQIDMETGVGLATGQGSNPQVMLQVSKDGGHTWGVEQWCKLGAIGSFLQRAIWRRLGLARDFTFKIRITDPIKKVIFGASIDVEVLNG